MVKSSFGKSEKRYVVETPLQLNGQSLNTELTLTNRDSMGFRMLLGREAMNGRILVDPNEECLCGNYSDEELKSQYPIVEIEKTGLEVIETATGKDIAGMMIHSIEKKLNWKGDLAVVPE